MWICFCACVNFMRKRCMIGRFEWVVGAVWFPFHSSWVWTDVMYIQVVISKHIQNIAIFSYTVNGVKRTVVISKIKHAWNRFILKTSSWCFIQNRGNGICIDKWSCIEKKKKLLLSHIYTVQMIVQFIHLKNTLHRKNLGCTFKWNLHLHRGTAFIKQRELF